MSPLHSLFSLYLVCLRLFIGASVNVVLFTTMCLERLLHLDQPLTKEKDIPGY